jgi:hypothetical protein
MAVAVPSATAAKVTNGAPLRQRSLAASAGGNVDVLRPGQMVPAAATTSFWKLPALSRQ